jgi:ferrochelatase
MAYGTPRHPDDLEGYYTDIRRGRPPTPELLADLRARYDAIGGLSPLAERTEAQRRSLAEALRGRGLDVHVALGMKHAEPRIEATVEHLAGRGVERIVAMVLAPHYSSLSVGQYLERAEAAAALHGIEVVAIDSWHLLPEYLAFETDAVREGLRGMPANTKVLFTAHSLPARVLDLDDPYLDQVRATASAVAAAAGLAPWAGWGVAWQSAGRTPEPWLRPDLLSVIRELAEAEAADGVLVCACGFVAEHLEVLYDLDVEARRVAEGLGIAFARTPSVDDDPTVMQALAGVITERLG